MEPVTPEIQISEGAQDFAELMEEVKQLEPYQQEKLTFFVQGFMAASAGHRKENEGATA